MLSLLAHWFFWWLLLAFRSVRTLNQSSLLLDWWKKIYSSAIGRQKFTNQKISLRKRQFCRLGNDLMHWLSTRERKQGSHKYCFWQLLSEHKHRRMACRVPSSTVLSVSRPLEVLTTARYGTGRNRLFILCGKGECPCWLTLSPNGRGETSFRTANWARLPKTVPARGGTVKEKIGLGRRWKFA